jgi:hypothetical protein
MNIDLILRGGTVVTEDATFPADLAIAGVDRAFSQWLPEAVRVYPDLRGANPDPDEADHQWLWTEREHADPGKEASAMKLRRASWGSSLSSEYAAHGRDWYPEVLQSIREAEIIAKNLGISTVEALSVLGISGGGVPGRPSGMPNGAGDDEDDDKEEEDE